jgi:hypothetical protein
MCWTSKEHSFLSFSEDSWLSSGSWDRNHSGTV